MTKIMLAFAFILCVAASVVSADDGVNWALLVAGSNEFYNYRHQVYNKNIKMKRNISKYLNFL